MQSLLILTTWVALGALSSIRLGPAGSWPIAMMFGPLWLPVAVELHRAQPSSQDGSQRHRQRLGPETGHDQ